MTHNPASAVKRVLLAEDDDHHAALITRALEDAPRTVELADTGPLSIRRVSTGEQALRVLDAASEQDGEGRPDLVLLDLKLPGINGLAVLEAIKADPRTRDIPVVVLSTSSAPSDRARAAALHANAYVVKPLDFACFERSVAAIRAFWCAAHEPLPAAVQSSGGGAASG